MTEIGKAFAEKFYRNKLWRRLSKEVLKDDKHECQICKDKGRYTPARMVHHCNYLLLHPELGLEKFYVDDDGNTKRNLISICFACHEGIHKWVQKEKVEPLTVERW